MHVDTIRSHQKAADGTVREYRSHLLRHSFRDERGRPRKETLANLTALPDAALEAVRKVLRGEAVVSRVQERTMRCISWVGRARFAVDRDPMSVAMVLSVLRTERWSVGVVIPTFS